jgi:hypothetical protein
MNEAKTDAGTRIIQVGPDRVTIKDNEVIIEAKRKMPDWEVRELNPIPVYFEDKKYYLVEQRKCQGAYAIRYLLFPWREDEFHRTKLFYAYDAEAVKERDADFRSGNLDELTRFAMFPFYPFLGLLWSGTQKRLTRFGFIPHAISGASIFANFCLLFAQGVMVVITINATARAGKMMIGGLVRSSFSHDALRIGSVFIPIMYFDILLTVALIADLLIRYSYHLHDHEWAGGFLEWIIRRPKKEFTLAAAPQESRSATVSEASRN